MINKMNSDRKASIIVGILFLLGFAGAFSAIILKPILDDPNIPINLTENRNLVMLGAFLELVMAFACANIAIWLYPVLKKHNKFLALGAVGLRIIENVFQIVGTLGLLLLLTLSQEAAKADAPAASTFQIEVALLLAVRFWAPLVLAQIAFCLGALMYYCVFYQSKLIPRWLSGWGIVAIILHLTSTFLVMFLHIDPFSGSPIIFLSIPIGLQELTLAAWLIVKGFNQSVIASASAKVDMNYGDKI